MEIFNKHFWCLLILGFSVKISYSMDNSKNTVPLNETESRKIKLNKPLFEAIKEGNKDFVAKYIEEKKVDINCTNDLQRPLLREAIEEVISGFRFFKANKWDRLKILELLLRAGARINAVIKGTGRRPLELAIVSEESPAELVDLLLSYGAAITRECHELVQNKFHEKALVTTLMKHINLRWNAIKNPSSRLLQYGINRNPYIVYLICINKPESIKYPCFAYAYAKSPYLCNLLAKTLKKRVQKQKMTLELEKLARQKRCQWSLMDISGTGL